MGGPIRKVGEENRFEFDLIHKFFQTEIGALKAREVVPWFEAANKDEIGHAVESGCQLRTIRTVALENFNKAVEKGSIDKQGKLIRNKLQTAIDAKKSGFRGFFRRLFYTFAETLGIPTEISRSLEDIKRFTLSEFIVKDPEAALEYLFNADKDNIESLGLDYDKKYDNFKVSEFKKPEDRAVFTMAVVNVALRKQNLQLIEQANKLLQKEPEFLKKIKDNKLLEQWNKKKRLVAFLSQSKLEMWEVDDIHASMTKKYEGSTLDRMESLVEELENDKVPLETKKVLIYDVIEWLEDNKIWGEENKVNRNVYFKCFAVYHHAKTIDPELANVLSNELGKKFLEQFPDYNKVLKEAKIDLNNIRKCFVGIEMNNKEYDQIKMSCKGRKPFMTTTYYTDIDRNRSWVVNGELIFNKKDKIKPSNENIQETIINQFGKNIAKAIQPIANQGTLAEIIGYLPRPLLESNTGFRFHGQGVQQVLHLDREGNRIIIKFNVLFPVTSKHSELSLSIGYLAVQRKITIPEKQLKKIELKVDQENEPYEQLIPGGKIVDTIGEFIPGDSEQSLIRALASVDPNSASIHKPKERPLPVNFQVFCWSVVNLEIGNEKIQALTEERPIFEKLQKLVGDDEAWSLVAFLNTHIFDTNVTDQWVVTREGDDVYVQGGQKRLKIPRKTLQRRLVEIDDSMELEDVPKIVPGVEIVK